MDREILSKKRDGRNLGDLCEIRKVPLEEFLIGEDGHTGCTAIDIALGLADGIEVGIDNTGRRRGLLHLRNDA